MNFSRRTFFDAAAAIPLGGRHAVAESASGILRFGLSGFPPNMQPWQNVGTAATTVKLALYRGLLGYGPDGALRGEIAEHWERDGDTGWVFHLRDAQWHNGAPVTSADVRWCIEQAAGEKSTAYLRNTFQSIVEIQTPDARTIRLATRQPAATLPLWMASCYMPIIAANSLKPNGEAIGCGPFKWDSAERGTSITVTAFDKFYRPGLPKLKNIVFTAYPDDALRTAALQSGDADIVEFLPWPDMTAVEQNPKLRLAGSTGGLFMFLQFNARNKPIDDPRVRQAVAMAIKREDIVKAVFYGRGEPLAGLPLAPSSEYTDAGLAQSWAYDPDKAKALLRDAGVGDGFSCKLLATAQFDMHKGSALIVQQDLAAIGIQADLVLPDWPTRLAAKVDRDCRAAETSCPAMAK